MEPKVNVVGGECGLVIMTRVSLLVWKHRLVDDWVKHDCVHADANRDQRAWGKRRAISAAGCWRVGHREEA